MGSVGDVVLLFRFPNWFPVEYKVEICRGNGLKDFRLDMVISEKVVT